MRGFLNGVLSSSSCCSFNLKNAECGIYTSPRTSRKSGASGSSCGMSLMVMMFSVTSSPTTPSPRVEPRTSWPMRYSRLTDRPSILASTTYSGRMPASRTRVSNSRSSSNENASCRLSILTAWVTLLNLLLAVPPTCCVGELAVTSSGYSASICLSSRFKASYSKSSSSGASWS